MKKGIIVFVAALILTKQTLCIHAEETELTGTEETVGETLTAVSENNEETGISITGELQEDTAELVEIPETVIDEESEDSEKPEIIIEENAEESDMDEETEDTELSEEDAETEQSEIMAEEEPVQKDVTEETAEETSETVIGKESEEDTESEQPEAVIGKESEEDTESEQPEAVIEEESDDKNESEAVSGEIDESALSHNYAVVKKPSYTGAEKMVYLSANGSTPLSDKDIRAWADQLRSKKTTAAAMVRSMLWDLVKKNPSISNEDFVKSAYQTIMEREADQGGLNKNVSALDSGVSYDYVIAALTNSKEFTNLCSSYKVTKGSVSLTQARDRNLNVTRFMTRLYQYCMERKPDTGGLNNWCAQINAGKMSAADVVKSFFSSNEITERNLSNEEIVRLAYRTMLDREPDSSGQENWVGCLDAGMTKNYVLKGFVGSQEFMRLCRNFGVRAGTVSVSEPRDKNANITKFVARLYLNCFGRKYDVSGLNNWTKQLNAQAVSGGQTAYAFYTSKEMENLALDDDDYIRALYKGVLGREAKPEEVSSWSSKMKAGTSRSQMIMNFVYSPEFKSLCGKYGIAVGQALSYNIPFYTQTDSRWSGVRFGAWTLGESGCSPTSIAMALSGVLNKAVLPNEVGAYLYNNTQEYNRIICGSSGAAIPAAVSAWNASSKAIGTVGDLKAELARGKAVVFYANYQYIGTSVKSNTHSIVLYGNNNGRTYVRDPGMPWKNGWYSIDTLWSQRSTDSYDLRGGYVSYSVMR